MPFTPQEGVAIAIRHPADFAPNQAFGYSDTNYLLLGLVPSR
jgi:D-alanyl-D-alanine carboxypeptidase